MASEMIFESRQTLHLDFDEPITSAMLIDHIKGLEVMARNATYFLEGLLKMELPPSEVLITSVQLNSIEDGWIFRICFGSGEAGKKKFEEFRIKMGIDTLTRNQMVGYAIVGVIAYSAWQFWPAKTAPTIAEPHPINVFNVIGNSLGKNEDEIMKLLELKIANVEAAKQGLVKLTRPGGVASTGDIVLNGNSVIPANYLENVPTAYDKVEAEKPFRDIDKTTVTFRAVDLDKTTGWWAILDDIYPNKRVAVQLSEDIAPTSVRTGEKCLADVTVTFKSKEEKIPVRIQVRRIHAAKTP